jgi:hypothetical protein
MALVLCLLQDFARHSQNSIQHGQPPYSDDANSCLRGGILSRFAHAGSQDGKTLFRTTQKDALRETFNRHGGKALQEVDEQSARNYFTRERISGKAFCR